MDAIYSGEITLSEENVSEVLPVASQLQLNEIVKECEQFLSTHISTDTCLAYLLISERYDLHSTIDKCNDFVLKKFSSAIYLSPQFRHISREQLCTYISDDRLTVTKGELEVFIAALKWYSAHVKTTDLANLMQYVRFPLIPHEMLVDEIWSLDLIAENKEVRAMVGEAIKFHSTDKLYLQPLFDGKNFQPRGEQYLVMLGRPMKPQGNFPASMEQRLRFIDVSDQKPFQNHLGDFKIKIPFDMDGPAMVTKGNYLFVFWAYCRF